MKNFNNNARSFLSNDLLQNDFTEAITVFLNPYKFA